MATSDGWGESENRQVGISHQVLIAACPPILSSVIEDTDAQVLSSTPLPLSSAPTYPEEGVGGVVSKSGVGVRSPPLFSEPPLLFVRVSAGQSSVQSFLPHPRLKPAIAGPLPPLLRELPTTTPTNR